MITCITPTGDREDSFREIVTCINNQIVKPDLWIIVDDGNTPISKDTLGLIKVTNKVIRLSPVPYHSLSRNLLYALDVTPDGDIIIIEDDEWYGPDYIQQRCEELKTVQLTGDRYRYRYSLASGGTWGISRNSSFSCLHSTAFRSDIKDKVYEAIASSDRHDADVRIWNAVKADNNLTHCVQTNNKPYMVTIKAWPTGRAGTMGLHRRPLGNNDTNGSKLREWLGTDADRYIKYISAPNVTFTKVAYGFWRQDNPTPMTYSVQYKEAQHTTEEMAWLRLGYFIGSTGLPINTLKTWNVCDVGSGNGEFAKVSRNVFGCVKEYDLCGITISEHELYSTKWDCIFLTDVLEHYTDINDLFKINFKYLFLSFPECPNSDNAEELQGWRHYKPNEHIYMLNSKGVRKWLNDNKCVIVDHNNIEDPIRKSPYSVNISTIIAFRNEDRNT